MSFGLKLDDFPLLVPAGGEVVAVLKFPVSGDDFEQHATIYLEEAEGIRTVEVTVRSAP